jgi:AcrR family transcriptional regulator
MAGDTRDRIMEATYQALARHGYVDLTIQRIADEFEKSKSLIYYHYDDKDDLLADFFSFMRERFEQDILDESGNRPREKLERILEHALPDDASGEKRDFLAAIVELKGVSASEEMFQDEFDRTDEFLRDSVEDVLREGVESGDFSSSIKPESFASLVVSAINGAMADAVTGSGSSARTTKKAIFSCLERGEEA